MSEANDHIELEGKVVNSVKGILSVELETGQVVQTYITGKMRKNKINVVVGDKVRVKISPYDLTKGFIIRRL